MPLYYSHKKLHMLLDHWILQIFKIAHMIKVGNYNKRYKFLGGLSFWSSWKSSKKKVPRIVSQNTHQQCERYSSILPVDITALGMRKRSDTLHISACLKASSITCVTCSLQSLVPNNQLTWTNHVKNSRLVKDVDVRLSILRTWFNCTAL